jgi:hypothetical protein
MRSIRLRCAVHGAVLTLALALAQITGCGSSEDGQTDLAKLPPPSQATIDAAKARPKPQAPPKFGSPPRSAATKP